ncbi:MAG: 50S ribosomal protein L9 [Candidatus Omnitrophica bacterium]|nr:50S ribosomal protein L9 [Candidatus Omnitrophota bacterium]MDD5352866.1 50S ribosomal protein L9 [Candidatus Omnitrophota bacterium]MDD5550465.1 50S ribosomal protein L9 [Candidatus Omnitrophota bacterium]
MKVILRKDIEKLGKRGDIISIKDGFARNFLLPNGFALAATKDNVVKIEQEKKKIEQDKKTEKGKAQELAEKLKNFSCTIAAEANDDNLYGSVTALEIAKALEEENIPVNKSDILLEQPIKKLGIYEVETKLHPEVSTKIKIWIVKK